MWDSISGTVPLMCSFIVEESGRSSTTFTTFSESMLLNCFPVWGGQEGGVPGCGSKERAEHEGGREVLRGHRQRDQGRRVRLVELYLLFGHQ